MLRKLFCVLIVIVAIVLAVLALGLTRQHLPWVVTIANFFEIMIPTLGVGALINYLWKSNCS